MQISRNGEIYTVAEGYEWFWKIFADQSWEPSTFAIFDRFLDKEKVFVDIGAWIGPTVLYAAPRAKQVFAFEPDPVAYKALVQNLALNKAQNVVPYPIAVSDSWKGIDFGAKNALGDSMSSELWGKKTDSQVPAVSLESIVLHVAPSFIKIDIEGGEGSIFNGTSAVALAEIKPTIHLSLHTPWFAGGAKALLRYKHSIREGLKMYPYFYNENLQPINLEEAFNLNAFNSIVASFQKI